MNTNTRASRRDALVAAGAIENPTTEVTYFEGEPVSAYEPKVPAKVRDIAYFTGLATSALILLSVGVVRIWIPELAAQVSETGVVVGSAVGLITNGLGVVYRPGAQR